MQNAADIPYQLLGQLDQTSPLSGLSDNETPIAMQDATTAYITTMFYSALANLYLQSILPKTMTEVDDQMPRVKIALERSFSDFTKATKWLAAHEELINSSLAKPYYHEVIGLDKDAIKNIEIFYSLEV